MQLFFWFGNNSEPLFPYVYSSLSPQLLDSVGQPIRPQRPSTQSVADYNSQTAVMPPLLRGISMPLGSGTIVCLSATLFWQNDSLHLQVNLFESFRRKYSHNSWLFADLSSGTYQMQLLYTSPASAFILVEEVEVQSVTPTESITLCSEPMELHLVDHRSADPAIVVEEISFETIAPPRPIPIPPLQSKVQVPVEVGLRITNHSATAHRFSSYVSSLLVDIRSIQEPILRQQSKYAVGRGLECPIDTDFHLVMPGESIVLDATAYLGWTPEGTLALMRRGSPKDSGWGSGAWVMEGLASGAYQIRVTYRSVNPRNIFSSIVYQDFWCGMVHTPFVAVELVDP